MPIFGKVSNAEFDVEKFDGKINFAVWQVQVLDVLIQQGLHKALKGKNGKPAEISDDDWEEYDLQACVTIRLYLTKEVISHVVKEKSAASIWAKLESLYMKKPRHHRLCLKMQLFSFKMKEGTSMNDHVNDFNQLVNELLHMGEVIEDEKKALLLLVSLPDKYDHFVTTLLYGKKTIGYNEASAALLDHALRKKISSLSINPQGKSLEGSGRLEIKNKDKGRWRTKYQSKKNVECYNCHRTGHIRAECPSWKNKNERRKDKAS